ncbi:hypothetical protein GCM10023092_24410 [Rurimicrobium arvi]|uniref:Uncharacterized protein n=1 Tax=Rurimicrobium arvi TaxID=2049916 RepID=A0ABP8N168_9BACT
MFWNPKIPIWVPVSLYILCLLVSIFFLICYGYCLKTNPDLIRSEKFITDKLRIEKGFIGNDDIGLRETFSLPQNTIGEPQTTESIDGN